MERENRNEKSSYKSAWSGRTWKRWFNSLGEEHRRALGYVELTYALDAGLPFAALRNVAGEWVDANVRTIAAAARNTAPFMPPDCRLSITDAPGLGAYPVSSYTYFRVYEHQSNRAAGEALMNFLEWMLHDGQALAPQMHYAPLPHEVVAKEEHLLGQISLPTQ